jgi:hypothetical protein
MGGYNGYTIATTEEYNGTAWTAGGDLATARERLAGAGTQSAGLAFGGSPIGESFTAATEEYDGAAWATGNNLTTARTRLAGAGSQSAALAFGGDSASATESATEEYNPS